VLSVEDVGIYKPSRRVYRHAMQHFKCHDAPSVCFVSSNTWDAQGAAQFGFQVVRVNRNNIRDDNIPGKPARYVKALNEIPALV
jgi:2-haloacid dehalogenase